MRRCKGLLANAKMLSLTNTHTHTHTHGRTLTNRNTCHWRCQTNYKFQYERRRRGKAERVEKDKAFKGKMQTEKFIYLLASLRQLCLTHTRTRIHISNYIYLHFARLIVGLCPLLCKSACFCLPLLAGI